MTYAILTTHTLGGEIEIGFHRKSASVSAKHRQEHVMPGVDLNYFIRQANKLTEKIEKLPAFDPTGEMKSLTFADPNYWAGHTDEWTKEWDRISKGG